MMSITTGDLPPESAWFTKVPTFGKPRLRFFVLNDGLITYYAKEEEGKGFDRKGTIELTAESIITAKGTTLEISNPNRRWKLVANDGDQVARDWAEAVETYVSHLASGSILSSPNHGIADLSEDETGEEFSVSSEGASSKQTSHGGAGLFRLGKKKRDKEDAEVELKERTTTPPLFASENALLEDIPTKEDKLTGKRVQFRNNKKKEKEVRLCIMVKRARNLYPNPLSGKSGSISMTNVHVRIVGPINSEILARTNMSKSRDSSCVWEHGSFELTGSMIEASGAPTLPRPYVVLELWGRENTGHMEIRLGSCRVFIIDGFPPFASDGAWIPFVRDSPILGELHLFIRWKKGENMMQWEYERRSGIESWEEFDESSSLRLTELYETRSHQGTVQVQDELYEVDMGHLIMKKKGTGAKARRIRATEVGKINLSALPQSRKLFPDTDPLFKSLYSAMQCTYPSEETIKCWSIEQAETYESTIHVPPRCEHVLQAHWECSIGGKMGMLLLTPFRIIFIPSILPMARMVYNVITTSSTEVPSYVVLKATLLEVFGHRAFDECKDEVKRLLLATKGKEDFISLNSWLSSVSKRTNVMSYPIASLSKLELIPRQNEGSWTSSNKSQEIVATLAMNTKSCSSFSVDLLAPSFHNCYGSPHVHPSKIPKTADDVLAISGIFASEIRWMMGESVFAFDLMRHSRCQLDGACEMQTYSVNPHNSIAVERGLQVYTEKQAKREKKSNRMSLLNEPLGLSGVSVAVWQKDSDAEQCLYCNQPFTFRRRRHHCRHCGVVVCHECSPYKVYHKQYEDIVRTCRGCYLGQEPKENAIDSSRRLRSFSLAHQAWEAEKSRWNKVRTNPVEQSISEDIPWWSPLRDYDRILHNSRVENWELSAANKDYQICSTYPSTVMLPKNFDAVESAARFRSKMRFPACVWIHPDTKAPLCRCAQPRTGVTGQSNSDDVNLLHTISQTMPIQRSEDGDIVKEKLQIFDARAKLNAYGNQLKGMGFERVGHYGGEDQVNLVFLDIANIHTMRSSLMAVIKACNESGEDDPYAGVSGSNWLVHLGSIMKGAVLVAEALEKGQPSLVHCSDGWDRTTQISSIAQLLLDPYYRTIKGFCTLIDKEWCSFGHMFERRCGEFGKNFEKDDSSPVFLQWLDVVHQILQQFQTEFEFNHTLLFSLVEAAYSKWFGTFLMDSELERVTLNLDIRCLSFWDFVTQNFELFANPLYEPSVYLTSKQGIVALKTLKPASRPSDLVLWERVYRNHLTGTGAMLKLTQFQARKVIELERTVAAQREEIIRLQHRMQVLDGALGAVGKDKLSSDETSEEEL
eukprot:m.73495 g.73495  ORF g.73495 m.73495 type:complete len:1321 (-) comp12422_c1_seq1:2220-6182(-)